MREFILNKFNNNLIFEDQFIGFWRKPFYDNKNRGFTTLSITTTKIV
jgi:hypothetical protein